MNAGPEARQAYDHKKESSDDGTVGAAGSPGAGQRLEEPLTEGERKEGGALPAPSGIICLCVLAGRHQCAADPVQLTRALGLNPAARVTDTQILLAAKELGLKAKRAHRAGTLCRGALCEQRHSGR